MVNRSIGVLALFLLAAGCTRPEREPEAEVIRLLDLAPSAESIWPPVRLRNVPEAIDELRTWRQVRKRKIGRVSMFPEGGGDNRRALVVPGNTVHRFSVEIPEDATLRAGLGYVPPADSDGVELRFIVRLGKVAAVVEGSESEPEEILLDEPVTTRVDGGWLDVEVDLGRWSRQAVRLSLSVEGSAPAAPVWAAWSAPEIVTRKGSQSGPDVILIVLDTLRADRLGSYGHPVDTSPHLDRFAARGIRFERAVSQAPWTYPSHRSLFSGLFPTARGLAESPKLAQVLLDAGFRTEAVTGGGQMDFRMGFASGFETYRVFDWIRNLDWLEEWLEHSSRRRRFLFLHTYEIHDPYLHTDFVEGRDGGRVGAGFGKKQFWGLRPPVTSEEQAFVGSLYDGGIAYTDGQLGRLFDHLDETGVFDRSIVIVTSDHGEQFWEHGSWRHGMNLYDEQLLVPLIVRLPKSVEVSLGVETTRARVVEQQVRLVDLYPTLLDLFEIPVAHRLHGRSLKPILAGSELPPIDAFAERLNLENRDSKALRTERYKFIYSFPKARGIELGIAEHWELYDLTADPGEQVNLAERYPHEVAALEARLEALTQLLDDPLLPGDDAGALDPDLEERLRALGYLGD